MASLDLPAIDSSLVQILIGMDLSDTKQTIQVVRPADDEEGPAAHWTLFGWDGEGKIPRSLVKGPSKKRSVNLSSTQHDLFLN